MTASTGGSTLSVITAPELPHLVQMLPEIDSTATDAAKYVSRWQWLHRHLMTRRIRPRIHSYHPQFLLEKASTLDARA